MPQYRMQLSRTPASQLARDRIVTTFWLDTDLDVGALFGDPDSSNNLAEDAANAFLDRLGNIQGFTGWECRAYRFQGHTAPMGEPVATHKAAAEAGIGPAPGPREVALCLSYFADRNTPRRRGRMYIGPFAATGMAERPSDSLRDTVLNLAGDISGLGGVNVQWVQYSRADQAFRNVTDAWVDNEWDTQRSRGLRATTRSTVSVSG